MQIFLWPKSWFCIRYLASVRDAAISVDLTRGTHVLIKNSELLPTVTDEIHDNEVAMRRSLYASDATKYPRLFFENRAIFGDHKPRKTRIMITEYLPTICRRQLSTFNTWATRLASATFSLKKNLANKIFWYLARCEFWVKFGLRFWILVGYVEIFIEIWREIGF